MGIIYPAAKVIVNNETVLDVTNTTATPTEIAKGFKIVSATGAEIEGTLKTQIFTCKIYRENIEDELPEGYEPDWFVSVDEAKSALLANEDLILRDGDFLISLEYFSHIADEDSAILTGVPARETYIYFFDEEISIGQWVTIGSSTLCDDYTIELVDGKVSLSGANEQEVEEGQEFIPYLTLEGGNKILKWVESNSILEKIEVIEKFFDTTLQADNIIDSLTEIQNTISTITDPENGIEQQAKNFTVNHIRNLIFNYNSENKKATLSDSLIGNWNGAELDLSILAGQVLDEAKQYADDTKKAILGEDITETFDTLKEIEDWIDNQGGSAVELTKAIAEEAETRQNHDNALQENIDNLSNSHSATVQSLVELAGSDSGINYTVKGNGEAIDAIKANTSNQTLKSTEESAVNRSKNFTKENIDGIKLNYDSTTKTIRLSSTKITDWQEYAVITDLQNIYNKEEIDAKLETASVISGETPDADKLVTSKVVNDVFNTLVGEVIPNSYYNKEEIDAIFEPASEGAVIRDENGDILVNETPSSANAAISYAYAQDIGIANAIATRPYILEYTAADNDARDTYLSNLMSNGYGDAAGEGPYRGDHVKITVTSTGLTHLYYYNQPNTRAFSQWIEIAQYYADLSSQLSDISNDIESIKIVNTTQTNQIGKMSSSCKISGFQSFFKVAYNCGGVEIIPASPASCPYDFIFIPIADTYIYYKGVVKIFYEPTQMLYFVLGNTCDSTSGSIIEEDRRIIITSTELNDISGGEMGFAVVRAFYYQ